ncbi:MAG: hypothetical protein Q8K75_02725 [Chlamydiales bacterium]|nr:hypothetical protein [Chlamydiales bacterium]
MEVNEASWRGECSPINPKEVNASKKNGSEGVQNKDKPLSEIFASKESPSVSIKALKTLKINEDNSLASLNKAHKESRADALAAKILAGVEKVKGNPIESLANILELSPLSPPLSDAQLDAYQASVGEAAALLIDINESDKADQIEQTAQRVLDRQRGVRDRHTHLGKCVTAQEAQRLSEQQKQCPLIKDCLQYLRDAYELREDPTFTPQIAVHVEVLHSNLKKISEIIAGFENQPELLQGLTLLDFSKEYRVTLEEHLLGKQALTDAGVVEFKQAIEEIASRRSQAAEASSVQDIPPRRRITESALANQAKLQQVKRDGRAWLLKQENEVAALGTSVNIVKKVYDNSGKLIGYYKIGAKEESAASAMEHFMYDAAVVMGMERRFVPTGRIGMITKQDVSNSSDGKEVGIIDDQGDFHTITLETHVFDRPMGSIQVAHEGQTLHQLLADQKDLSKEETIIGVTTQIGMGMFDAHGSNVLVDAGGRISFFDNSRSLPQTNRPMAWAGKVILPFRSGFLRSDRVYEPLTEEDRRLLRNEAALWKERVGELRDFVDLSSSKARLESLPVGWWNSKNVLAAMSERVEGMERAVSDPNVRNLRDFTFACYPDLKFYGVLRVAILLEDKLMTDSIDPAVLAEKQKDSYGLARLDVPIDNIIDGAKKLGLDVAQVREWCQDSSLSFEQVMDKVAIAANLQVGQEEKGYRRRMADSFLFKVKADAVVELKDVRRADCLQIQYEKAIELLQNNGFTFEKESTFRPDVKPLGPSICRNGPTELVFCEKTLDGTTKLSKIDFSEVFEGRLFAVGDSGKRHELNNYYVERLNTYSDYLLLTRYDAEGLCPESSLLIRRPDSEEGETGNFVITAKNEGKITHYECLFREGGILVTDPNSEKKRWFANIEAVEVLLKTSLDALENLGEEPDSVEAPLQLLQQTEDSKQPAEELDLINVDTHFDLKTLSPSDYRHIQQLKAIGLAQKVGFRIDPNQKIIGMTIAGNFSANEVIICENNLALDGLKKFSKLDYSGVFENKLFVVDDSGKRYELLDYYKNKMDALPDYINLSINRTDTASILPENTWLVRLPDSNFGEVGDFIISINARSDQVALIHLSCVFNKSAIIVTGPDNVSMRFSSFAEFKSKLEIEPYSKR